MVRSFYRALLSSYPFYSGCGTIANQPFLRSATRGLGFKIAAPLRNGVHAIVSPNEYLGRSIYYTGDWDPKITWACKRILRPGDTFLDIGAHCGVSSLYASTMVGEAGKVHAFEPQPVLAEMLRESISLNELNNITVHEVALSERDGVAILHIQHDKPILASLKRCEEGPNMKVKTRHAGRYLHQLSLDAVRLIKIDVEGYEAEILRTSSDFLDSIKPDAVLFESTSEDGPFHSRDAVRILSDLGYSFYALPKRMVLMRAVPVGEVANPGWHDFIAVSAAAAPSIISRIC